MANIDHEERKSNPLDQRELEAAELRSMTECKWAEREREEAAIVAGSGPDHDAALRALLERMERQKQEWEDLARDVELAKVRGRAIQRASARPAPHRRATAGRAPRPVARASRVVRAEVADGGADGPPAPRHGPAAALVSDATALAVVGLSRRQFRDFVRERVIPCAKVGRRTLARLDHVLAALGLVDEPAPAADAEWSADALRAELSGAK